MTTPTTSPASSVPASAAGRSSSRLAAWLQAFIRHAGQVAVDHTHSLRLDRISTCVSGKTGPSCSCC